MPLVSIDSLSLSLARREAPILSHGCFLLISLGLDVGKNLWRVSFVDLPTFLVSDLPVGDHVGWDPFFILRSRTTTQWKFTGERGPTQTMQATSAYRATQLRWCKAVEEEVALTALHSMAHKAKRQRWVAIAPAKQWCRWRLPSFCIQCQRHMLASPHTAATAVGLCGNHQHHNS